MRHIGLFEGIGGFSLAAARMGWETIAWCEWNPFCQQVLKYYFPNAAAHGDITKTDFTVYRGQCDILTGGFPCQPFSTAGERKGTDDDRYLWPEMLRAIREIGPRWVVGENVRGLVGWNAGVVFEQVCADLEALSYEVWPFLLPACGVNAPHRRDRIWFVAYSGLDIGGTRRPESTGQFRKAWITDGGSIFNPHPSDTRAEDLRSGGENAVRGLGTIADAGGQGLQRGELNGTPQSEGQIGGQQPPGSTSELHQITDWRDFPTEPPFYRRDDGLPQKLAIFVVNEIYGTDSHTSQENRIENLPEMWERVSSPEIWEKVRRLYSLESKEILLQTMQLYSSERREQRELSPFSQEFSKGVLRTLREYGKFASTPQGQKLEKQREEQYSDALRFLPHEIPLAARAYSRAISKFEAWHRQEAIKAYGNAIVPQVAIQIFQAIQAFESENRCQ